MFYRGRREGGGGQDNHMCAARYTVGSALECLQRTRKDEDWKERKKDINGGEEKRKGRKKTTNKWNNSLLQHCLLLRGA